MNIYFLLETFILDTKNSKKTIQPFFLQAPLKIYLLFINKLISS